MHFSDQNRCAISEVSFAKADKNVGWYGVQNPEFAKQTVFKT